MRRAENDLARYAPTSRLSSACRQLVDHRVEARGVLADLEHGFVVNAVEFETSFGTKLPQSIPRKRLARGPHSFTEADIRLRCLALETAILIDQFDNICRQNDSFRDIFGGHGRLARALDCRGSRLIRLHQHEEDPPRPITKRRRGVRSRSGNRGISNPRRQAY